MLGWASTSNATATGFEPATQDSGSAAHPSHATCGRSATTTIAPTTTATPSAKTAPPGPITAARPAVTSAPNGSMPTNAAAQIASARARTSSVLIDCTTTVDKPTKRTPVKPPTSARPSDSQVLVD